MYKKDAIKTFIIHSMAMNLSEIDSLAYLRDRGYKISRQYFYKLKKDIRESKFSRLALIAKEEFVSQHLERIDTLNLIHQELWILYRKEKNTFKQSLILEKIADLQQYLSSYYDASRYVMEKGIQQDNNTNKKKRKNNEQTEDNQSISSA